MLRPSSPALVKPLIAHPMFALLWLGQTLSRLGDKLYMVGLAWWVLQKTGSAAAMGTVLVYSFIPMLFFMLFGGVAVDRFSRGKLLLGSDIVRGVLIALVTILALNNALEIWHIYGISIFFGLADAFFYPAYTAMIPEVVPTEMLTSANSLTELSKQFAGIGGPLLAGILIATSGTTLVFGINSLSFFLSALCLLPIISGVMQKQNKTADMPQAADMVMGEAATIEEPEAALHVPAETTTMEAVATDLHVPPSKAKPSAKAQIKSVFSDIRQGISVVAHYPWIWISILMAGLTNLTFTAPFETSLPLLIDQDLGGNVDYLSYIYAAVSVGAVTMAIVLSRLGKLRRRGLLAYAMWIMAGLAAASFGLRLPIELMVVAGFLRGAGMTGMNLLWITILQELVPREKLGRVASIDMLGSLALLPVGYAVAGIMSDMIGPSQVFLYGGLATAVMLTLAVMHPQIRNLD